MKESKEGKNLGRYPLFVVTFSQLACIVGLLYVQWCLFDHSLKIDHILKENMVLNDWRKSLLDKKDNLQELQQRTKRSMVFKSSNSRANGDSVKIKMIQDEVSRQLQHLLKTQVCAKNEKSCLRGPRGRRGKPGKIGPRGPAGKLGPRGRSGKSGGKYNITAEILKFFKGPHKTPSRSVPDGKSSRHNAVIITVPPKSVVVNESDMVSLYCGAKSFPAPTVTWQKVNSSLSGRHVVDGNGGLLIRHARKSDQGTYKCTATNIFSGEATAYATVTIQERDTFVAVKVVTKPTSIITEEGQNVTFTCAARGTPTLTVTWSKAFSTLTSHVIHSEIKNVGGPLEMVIANLTLTTVSASNSGLYVCKASSRFSSDSKTTQLTVLQVLAFSITPPPSLAAVEGQEVYLDCQALNGASVDWIVPDGVLRGAVFHNNGTLEITNVNPRNHGVYTCTARIGAYRKITATTHLTVSPTFRGLESSAILRSHHVKYPQTLTGYLDPVLKSSSTSRWERCWHAVEDGWDPRAKFHRQCDGKGPTVTIVKVGDDIFGGYTNIPWNTKGDFSGSNIFKSFLFSLHNVHGFHPAKMTLRGVNNDEAIYGSKHNGPVFGNGHDLKLRRQGGWSKESYARPGSYYAPPGCTYDEYCTFYTGNTHFRPNDIEVFYETTS